MLSEPRQFQLLIGEQIMDIDAGKIVSGQRLEYDTPVGREAKYLTGAVIETYTDLERLNVPGFEPKFRRLHDEPKQVVDTASQQKGETAKAYAERLRKLAEAAEAAAEHEKDTLDAMSETELRAFAEAEEYPLGDASTKAELIAAIRSATLVPA